MIKKVLSIFITSYLSLGVFAFSWADINQGLVAYYPFNGNVNDESGNGNHGIVYGAAETEDRYLHADSAYSFDGNNDYVSVIDTLELSGGSPLVMSVSVWFKANTLSSLTPIIGKALNNSSKDWSLIIKNGKLTFYSENGGSIFNDYYCSQTSGEILPNDWYHGVFVAIEPYIYIYVNGTMVGSCSDLTENSIDTAAPVQIGSFTYLPAYYSGSLDNIRIYNRALSADEIQQLYFLLSFPLSNYSPYTAPINAVFDHSMVGSYSDDDTVIAYTGEAGEWQYGSDLVWGSHYGFKNSQSGYEFIVNGNYLGGGDKEHLYYDGHPGYDYRTIDLGNSVPVYAVATGVAYHGSEDLGEVYIDHQNEYTTHYLHLVVAPNDSRIPNNTLVEIGDRVGIAGGTGGFPVHLHFEVRKKGTPVDPYGWEGDVDPYNYSNFNLWNNRLVRIGGTTPTYYRTLQNAIDAAIDGDTIQTQGLTYVIDLQMNHDKTIRLETGFDRSFSTNTDGLCTVINSLTISNGYFSLYSGQLQLGN